MDTIPHRSKIAEPYRYVIERLEKHLVFPIKDPNFYTGITLLLSLLFFFFQINSIQIILLIVILLFDWFDGAVARKYKGVSRNGYLLDTTIDRLSEGFIFASILATSFGKVLFFLYIINIALSFYAVKSGKHYVLALRFAYLLIFLFQLFW